MVNQGAVVSVRGGVVDVQFERMLPPVYRVLRSGAKRQIVIEVLEQLNARRVRGIALTPTQGLARGMSVDDTGQALQVPVGKGIVSRMFNVFGRSIDGGPGPATGRSRHAAARLAGQSFRVSEVMRWPLSLVSVYVSVKSITPSDSALQW